jgi:hypothetical protein
MMAHDSSSQRPDLSGPAIAGLEEALAGFLANPSDTRSVESALRVVTAEARAKQIHAEHLLVLLKDVWFSLPPIQKTPSGEPQNALLQRVITQCIREYYSG